jgi:hypothetical protein
MKRTRRRPQLAVTTGAKGVVAHTGARLLCELADDLGLKRRALGGHGSHQKRRRGHD